MQTTPFRCEACDFELWVPVGMLDVTAVGLYDDRRFPGRCLVALSTHVEHLDELDDAQLASFMRDVRKVGRAIREVTLASRVNYAVLGNVQPHLHAHVIPRGGTADVRPDRSPWQHPERTGPLDERQREVIVSQLRGRLRSRRDGAR